MKRISAFLSLVVIIGCVLVGPVATMASNSQDKQSSSFSETSNEKATPDGTTESSETSNEKATPDGATESSETSNEKATPDGATESSAKPTTSSTVSESETVEPKQPVSAPSLEDSVAADSDSETPPVPAAPAAYGDLKFKTVPTTLPFEEMEISSNMGTIKRATKNWQLMVEDSRQNKKQWYITAKQLTPFTSSNGEKLENILIYRHNQVDSIVNETNTVDIYSGTSQPNTDDYSVGWSEDEGLLLKIPPGQALSSSKYSSEIQLNLTDAPV